MECYICKKESDNLLPIGNGLYRCGKCNPMKAEEAKKVFELLNGLREAIKEEAKSYLKIGAYLYEIRKDKKYKLLGSHINNMTDLFKEEGIGRAHGNNYIRVYEMFKDYLKEHDIEIKHRRLIDILNMSNKLDKKMIPKLLEDAKTLTYEDFKDELNKAAGKKSFLECDHTETEAHIKCKSCGKWLS